MDKKESYVVRVTGIANADDLFTWEICGADGLQVIRRSTKIFSTRVEAIFDSASYAALSAPEAMWQLFIS